MVYVRLARNWVDGTGATHAAGDLVDVDAATLAELEGRGVVTPFEQDGGPAVGGPAVGGPAAGPATEQPA